MLNFLLFYINWSFLQECRICNSFGQNCRTAGKKAGEGIRSADFVFYILALETERCKKGFTVAYAAHCQQEAALDRSVDYFCIDISFIVCMYVWKKNGFIGSLFEKLQIIIPLFFSYLLCYNFFRPIAGYANLCPSSISLKQQEVKTLLSTVKHEILHALGFSVSLYAFYRDDDGNPLTNRTENGKPILNEQ